MAALAAPGSDHFPAGLTAARELAKRFNALGYHAAYGDRGGVEIRRDDAAAILKVLESARHASPGRDQGEVSAPEGSR